MITAADLDAQINAFAQRIGGGPLGLAHHHAEAWALPNHCFDNVREMVARNRGEGQPGWVFLCRRWAGNPTLSYIMAVHHAVWHRPNGHLVDVTPFHENPLHQPHAPGGSVLFLVDDLSPPIALKEGALAPRATRYFAMNEDPRLARYLLELSRSEEERCQQLYASRA
jgi:hypothetical protein